MPEYLIKGETLTELANTMRDISDGVPNPCTIEQMKQCLPNIHKTVTGLTPVRVIENGVEVYGDTEYGENLQSAELYRTYGDYGTVPNREKTPYKKIDSIVTTDIFNHPSGENSVVTYKLKGLSKLGYKSGLSFSQDCYSAILYYSDTSGNDDTTYTLHHTFTNEWSDAYPTYFKFSEIGTAPIVIRDLMGRIEGIGRFYKDAEMGDLDLEINLFGVAGSYNGENTGITFGIAKNGLIVKEITVRPPESLEIS